VLALTLHLTAVLSVSQSSASHNGA